MKKMFAPRGLGCFGAFQRIARAFIKSADFLVTQALVADLDGCAEQQSLGQFLDRETDSFRCFIEAAVFHPACHLAVARREKLGRSIKVEVLHGVNMGMQPAFARALASAASIVACS
ncbi:MAG TPA: hypothetical protein VFA57_03715 [Pseudolabrys sp.]|nr:hypothetical protein [Pseudolabrys sp.]